MHSPQTATKGSVDIKAGGDSMLLGELAQDLPIDCANPGARISGLTADSRLVAPGFLFAAIRGTRADGAAFARSAVSLGAAAILADIDAELGVDSVPVIRAKQPRRILAMMAARFYPRQPEKLVAVTGTSGKTSVAHFTRQIFEHAGHRAASIGTVGVTRPHGHEPGSLTTPDPVALHRLLDELAGQDAVTHAVLEASSHGLDQRRLDGLRLTAAGFTNLGRDHLDYHAGPADYLAAKLRLFGEILPPGGVAVINADSDVAVEAVAVARSRGSQLMLVGRAGGDIRIVTSEGDGLDQRLTLEIGGRQAEVNLPLAGEFQADNAIMAAGLAIATGIDPETAIEAMHDLKGATGRLEKVADTPSGATIFIDYAHKPEALTAALTALRPLTTGRLVVVFGAGGDRDRGKRSVMGAAAAQAADIVIVTDDNPRSEDPAAIRAEILAGTPDAIEIAGRGEAISAAVAMLRSGDVLCVAGKGHEVGQTIGGQTLPFSDHEAVRAAVAAL